MALAMVKPSRERLVNHRIEIRWSGKRKVGEDDQNPIQVGGRAVVLPAATV